MIAGGSPLASAKRMFPPMSPWMTWGAELSYRLPQGHRPQTLEKKDSLQHIGILIQTARTDLPARDVLLQCELVVRDSCGARHAS